MMSPIIVEMIDITTRPNFEFLLWDLAFDNESGEPRRFRTAFNTGVTAIRCFKLYAGIPENERLIWFGSADIGYIIEPETGWYVAKYQFIEITA
jgi:hypothetical protein